MGRKAGDRVGLIHRTGKLLFDEMEAAKAKQQAELKLHVSFEILREEARDLLDAWNVVELSTAAVSTGATLVPVTTLSEMAACLEQGSLSRATASAKMHRESSRPHAIFTITLEQLRKLHSVSPADETSYMDMRDEYFCSKLYFVDFDASGKRSTTSSDGTCLRRGTHVDEGLPALGNVMAVDETKKKEGLHVPHQDSSLTPLLQDSLGGNSKTVILACISPADIDNEETLNTLQYVNRVSSIQNKLVANHLISSEMHRTHQQLKYLQAQLCATDERALANKNLQQKINWLEAMNKELSEKLDEYHGQRATIEQREIDGRSNAIVLLDESSLETDDPEQEWEQAFMLKCEHRELIELNKRLEEKEDRNNMQKQFQGNDKLFHRLLDMELEVSVKLHEVRLRYEMLRKKQAALLEDLAILKQVNQLAVEKTSAAATGSSGPIRPLMMSPDAIIARIVSLEDSLSESSNKLASMTEQLSNATEGEPCSAGWRCWNQIRTIEEAERALQHTFYASVGVRCQLREKNKEIENIKSQLHKLVYLLRTSEVQRKELVKEQKTREQADSMALAVAVLGKSPELSDHYTEISNPSTPTELLRPRRQKLTPRGSLKGPAAFLEDAGEMEKMAEMPMKTLVTVGRSGKLTRSKTNNQQWLLQFRWKWPKTWKVSEWIKHNDETIATSKLEPDGSN